MINKNGIIYTGKPYVFQGGLAAGTAATYESELTAPGTITDIHIKFAAGENGTLHIRPMVIQNGEIPIDLVSYGPGLNQFVSGDDEQFNFKCFMPVENGTKIRINADNTGAYLSFVDVAVIVEYADTIREYSIIEGAMI